MIFIQFKIVQQLQFWYEVYFHRKKELGCKFLLRSYFISKYSYNFKMSQAQQNKQVEQPKRIPNLKFLSIKSVIRNKKIIVKKTVPAFAIYPKHNNTYSTSDLQPNNLTFQKDQVSHRGFSLYKPSCPGINTNIVTIKFGEEKQHLHKSSEKKIRKKMTNTFNICGQQHRKIITLKDKIQFGAVEDSLIIEPLQKLENHFGWDRRKGFYNYMLLTRKNKNDPHTSYAHQGFNAHETVKDLRQFGKQITQTELMAKKRSHNGPKLQRVTTSFLKSQPRHGESVEQKQSRTIQLTPAKTMQLIDIQKQFKNKEKQVQKIRDRQLQKAKQKQIYEALLKQYRELLPKKVNNSKNYFVFGMSDKSSEPQNKIELYRDFLWKMNYSNGLFVFTPDNIDFTYKAFIGFGNNSCMVKSILRRRSWWTVVDTNTQMDSCNFVWTQLKINNLFKGQVNRLQKQTRSNEIQEQNEQLNYQIEPQQDQSSYLAHKKIFNSRDIENWQHHLKRNSKTQQKLTQQTLVKRLKLFAKKPINKIMDSQKLKLHNHLQFNFFLGNKKALFYNIKRLCQLRNQNPFDHIPLTFHLTKGTDDPVYEKFLNYYKKLEDIKKVDKNFRNIWICKPGENTNRGNGISVCSGLDDIRHRLRGKEKNGDGKARTFILQKYIQKPFLYKNRKFDIRHYMLLTCLNGNIKAYWFQQGYIRTSSSIFNLKNSNDLMIHLTNDAVQKKGDSYGKHEKGNKISYEDFQKHLDSIYKKKYDFLKKTLQKMKKIALTAVQSTFLLLDPNRKEHNFQLIGLDFMLDQNFRPWLIQANTNPCLQLSSPLLQKLIPSVVQQTFRICIDPFFPPPENSSIKNRFYGQNALLQNRFQLIFDESVDGDKITKLIKEKEGQGSQFAELIGKVEQDNQLFEDDGNDNWQEKNTN